MVSFCKHGCGTVTGMASKKADKNPIPPKAKKAYNEISQATYANLMTKREKSMGKSPSASTRQATASNRAYNARTKGMKDLRFDEKGFGIPLVNRDASVGRMYRLKQEAGNQGEKRYAQSVRPSSLRQTRKKKNAR